MIKLKNEKRNYEINVPTKFSEIDFEAIKEVVSNVNVSEHYAIISLAQSFQPFALTTMGSKANKNMNIPVSANFIVANDPGSKIKANTGDKVIISRSDLELAVHLPITFGLTTSAIISTIEDNVDMRVMLRDGALDEKGNPVTEMIAIEFKLVPLTAIKAVIDRNKKITDIYRTSLM